jgi:hypothetical protein
VFDVGGKCFGDSAEMRFIFRREVEVRGVTVCSQGEGAAAGSRIKLD